MEILVGGEKHPVNVEELVGKVPELGEIRGKLRERYLREPGIGAEAAEARAQRSVHELVRAALTDFGNAFVAEKSALLDQILVTRQAIHDFYSVLMETGGKPPSIEEVRGKFGELRKALNDVAKPAEDMAAEAKAGDELAAEKKRITDELKPTPKPAKAKIPVDATTVRLFKKGFRFVEKVGRWVKRYVTGRVEYEIVDGKYKVSSFKKGAETPTDVFSEFDTLAKPYKDKPLSSSVMQAHHGCQDALMDALFGANSEHGDLGYNGGDAPTMWLRNSTGESPHGRITHEFQNPNEATRKGDPELSYAKIRELGVQDLKAIGAPDAKIAQYLDEMDAYFKRSVLPKIQDAVREGRLSPKAAGKLIGGELFGKVVP